MVRTVEALPAGPFTAEDAAELGVSESTLYRMARAGKLEKVAPGLFLRPGGDAVDTVLLDAATRASRATICLSSALAHYDLVDEIPAATDLALPRGAHRPDQGRAALRWHWFDADTFELGRDTIIIDGTRTEIGIYTAARSIVDVFRLRGVAGYEIGIEALRSWLRRRGSHPAELIDLAARLPRAETPLRTALDHLA